MDLRISIETSFLMILDCITIQQLGLPERHITTGKISPYGDALVFVKTIDLLQMGIHLSRNPMSAGVMDVDHPLFGQVTPVWVRIVEKCEDGSFLGFQTDLRSRPFGVKACADQMVKFYGRKTLVAA